jgi:hypothetical protein
VRQKLSAVTVPIGESTALAGLEHILCGEVNVGEVRYSDTVPAGTVVLDTQLTPELEREGLVREVIRAANDLRKKASLVPADTIELYLHIERSGEYQDFSSEEETLKKETRAKSVTAKHDSWPAMLLEKEFSLRDYNIHIGIRKI